MTRFITKPLVLAVALSMPALAFAESALMLEEVIVTAQKREQSLQEVPVSVNAVSGEAISDGGIANLEGLSAQVPNLTIHEGPNSNGIFIRGLGSGNNEGFEQSVGMFVDGIYAGKAQQFQAAFMDVAGVEVLRGPQGTLFGKNTIAGALTITSAKPSEELEASVQSTYEPEYGTSMTEAVLSGPVTDTLSGRIALRHNETDGYLYNTLQNDDELNNSSDTGRVSLLWEASDDAEVYFKYEKGDSVAHGRNSRLDDSGSYEAGLLAADPNYKIDESQRSTSVDETLDINSQSATLQVDYALDEHELTLITGFSEYDARDVFDADFSAIDSAAVDRYNDFSQLSQEVRLTSELGNEIDYIVGLYYQTTDYLTDSQLGVKALGQALGLRTYMDQTTDTFAAFGSLSYHPAEDLHLTFGLRYTKEEKQATRELTYTEYLSNDAATGFTAVLAGLALPAQGFYEHEVSGERTSENWSPSVKVSYDLNNDVMLYASLSQAFKSGGFNALGGKGENVGEYPAGGSPASFEFGEEEALALELGGKTTLLDGAATLNFALFRTEYSDLQVSAFENASFVVGNAGEAISQGLEVDGVVRLTESLTLNGSMAYLDATYSSYANAGCTYAQSLAQPVNCTQDLGGSDLANAPEFSANLGLEHVASLTERFDLVSHLGLTYSGEHYIASDLDERSLEKAHTIVNGRLGLMDKDGRFDIALIGKNLTNEVVRTFVGDPFSMPGAQFAFYGEPRTLAVQLKVSY